MPLWLIMETEYPDAPAFVGVFPAKTEGIAVSRFLATSLDIGVGDIDVSRDIDGVYRVTQSGKRFCHRTLTICPYQEQATCMHIAMFSGKTWEVV